MLIEFHPHHIPESHRQQLFDLKIEGVTPIIAHPERYKDSRRYTFSFEMDRIRMPDSNRCRKPSWFIRTKS